MAVTIFKPQRSFLIIGVFLLAGSGVLRTLSWPNGRSGVLRTRRAEGMTCCADMESVARMEHYARMGELT